mgnify:FL=1
MEKNLAEATPLEAILATEGVSRRQAERLFRSQIGVTPGRYYRELRIQHAIALMCSARIPVHQAALAAGFISQPVFSRACKRLTGHSPRVVVAGLAAKPD